MIEIFIGYDPREKDALKVCRYSLCSLASSAIEPCAVELKYLQNLNLYTRDIQFKDGKLWDPISEAPMSTEFAISRFFVPYLATTQWVLFCDCDMLFLADVYELLEILDERFAVMCTQHVHLANAGLKMDGCVQTSYSRKNWSSFMLFNTQHPSNKKLTLELLNTVPGRDLHRFCWLADHEIGSIPLSWNHLVGEKPPINGDGLIYPQYCYKTPKNVHFTLGIPSMPGYENCEYADEWRRVLYEAG